MMRIVEIGNLRLGLPERGMPVINPAAADRAGRINGMDLPVPANVLLPTGHMGNFGWPAISGHRDGQAFTLEFGDWTVSANRLTGHDRASAIDIAIAIEAMSMRCTLSNRGDSVYTLDR